MMETVPRASLVAYALAFRHRQWVTLLAEAAGSPVPDGEK